MACPDFVAKYLLYCVSFVITLISFIVIGLGVALLFISKGFENTVPSYILIVPIAVIVCGCLIFVISSFGCCGTIAEKPCLLVTYALFMLLLFGGNIYLSIQFRGNMAQVSNIVESQLENTFNDTETRPTFLIFEGLFKCCGTSGPDAYVSRNLTIPVTCCPNPTIGNITIDDVSDIDNIQDIQMCQKEDSYHGCTAIFVDVVDSFANGIYYFIIAIIVVQCVGILSSIYLAFEFRTKKEKEPHDIMMYPPPPQNPRYY